MKIRIAVLLAGMLVTTAAQATIEIVRSWRNQMDRFVVIVKWSVRDEWLNADDITPMCGSLGAGSCAVYFYVHMPDGSFIKPDYGPGSAWTSQGDTEKAHLYEWMSVRGQSNIGQRLEFINPQWGQGEICLGAAPAGTPELRERLAGLCSGVYIPEQPGQCTFNAASVNLNYGTLEAAASDGEVRRQNFTVNCNVAVTVKFQLSTGGDTIPVDADKSVTLTVADQPLDTDYDLGAGNTTLELAGRLNNPSRSHGSLASSGVLIVQIQ